jgi:hypothetical protein
VPARLSGQSVFLRAPSMLPACVLAADIGRKFHRFNLYEQKITCAQAVAIGFVSTSMNLNSGDTYSLRTAVTPMAIALPHHGLRRNSV